MFDDNDWKNLIPQNGTVLKIKPLKEVSQEYNIKIKNVDVKLNLTFAYNVRHTDSKNNKLGEVNTNLSFRFTETQSPDILVECYRLVHKILSILTMQSNIKIDSISTYQKDERNTFKKISDVSIFECTPENYVNKSSSCVIPFRVFDNCFDKFINVIMNEEFSTNFLPSNNNDVNMVDYDLVKNICTALEFEFQANKAYLNINKNELINELSTLVKKEVQAFKNLHTELSERFFSYINSNIATWSLPATEQYMCLYNFNKDILDKLLNTPNLVDMKVIVNEDNINKFVKLRNLIVHGNRPPITQENANFSYAMKLLIYISMLKRMGLNDDIIYNIMDRVL